jgi:hypothetical protein
MKGVTVENAFELLKPENWGYLVGLMGFMGLIQWLGVRSSKKNNNALNLDTDELSIQEIARAWTKGHILAGAHRTLFTLTLTCVICAIGLVFLAFDLSILAIAIMIFSLIFAFVQLRKIKVIDLTLLSDGQFEELKEYYDINREALTTEVLNDTEVIQAMNEWPSWIRKYNLRAARSKNFRPVRNKRDYSI